MGKIIFKSNSRSVLSRTNNNTVIISYPVANRVDGSGFNLLYITLNGGQANVSGYFEWLYPNTEVLQNGAQYPVFFIPDDPEYDSVIIQVPVYYIAPAVISVFPTTPDIIFDPQSEEPQIIDGPLLDGEARDPYTNEPVSGTWEWGFGSGEDFVFLYAYSPQPVMLPIIFIPDDLDLFGNSAAVYTDILVNIINTEG